MRSWGSDSATPDCVIDLISQGKSFDIWCGYHKDIPWADGKCSLRVKVGKKRKLVSERIETHRNGWDDSGDYYALEFTPSHARKLRK